MSVAVALTPEEQAQEAQMLLMLDQQFSMNPNDPTLGGMYSAPQRHAMISRAFELLNIKNGASFLFDPNSPEYQQQQQAMQEQQQQAEAKAAEVEKFQAGMTARQVAVLEGQLELDVMKEQNKMLLEMEKLEHDQEQKDSRLLMDVEKQNHDMEMDEKELAVEKVQKRNVSVG
jgi:glucose/arabinose dehydrogenase